ncbi:MAG: hypothetical protein JWL99_840 [Streptomyces oryziradicis]|nr:hypothetical protein [Actinacidiphila oryziradicis]
MNVVDVAARPASLPGGAELRSVAVVVVARLGSDAWLAARTRPGSEGTRPGPGGREVGR